MSNNRPRTVWHNVTRYIMVNGTPVKVKVLGPTTIKQGDVTRVLYKVRQPNPHGGHSDAPIIAVPQHELKTAREVGVAK